MIQRKEWNWVAPSGDELRLMALPGLKALYLVLHDADGMHQIARTLDDRAAVKFAAWLDLAMGEGEPA